MSVQNTFAALVPKSMKLIPPLCYIPFKGILKNIHVAVEFRNISITALINSLISNVTIPVQR